MDDQPGAARLCALLGDVGMGKTTTAKLFSQRLLQLRKKDAGVPLPILFDLREVRIPELRTAMTLDEILDGVLDMTRPANVSKERLNARVVREHVDRGEAVIVFDGLDEVLVHLSPHDQTLFTRQLWRALDEDGGSKMLLTCRTQYFRTIRDEVTYFTGETRAGLRADDYLALLMRPFRDDQVREYLIANLDCDQARVDGFLETIAAVHDLPDLARRPITLRLIADQLDFIEQATLEGRTVYSVNIYSEVVDRWISRDAGKHTLTPDHKRLLMEEIAAALWRSGQNAWSPAEVDEWLLEVLEHRPDLRRHYGQQMPELWKADFRTATFLKREGDEFQFAHRSLFEYFLAQYLFRALSSPSANFEALAMAVPNLETLGFLAQSVASAPDKHRAAALNSLRLIASSYEPEVSELALAYALHAERHGHPHQSLVGVQLAGADLRDWEFGAEDRDVSLLLARANFAGADLRHTSFAKTDLAHADFTGADLASAEFHSSTLTGSSWQETRAAGVILRECRVDGDVLGGASLHRTQVLNCTPSPDPRPGLLVAPHADPGQFPHPRVGHFTANASTICGTAWSPDGSHIATASSDGTAGLWDATTGELVHTFIGHTDWVRAVSWSPDGTRIVTSSDDQTARVWNTVTGETTHLLTGHTDWVQSVAWSPDGTHVLTGSDDGTARIWSTTTGRTTRLLNPGDGIVIAVAWSPDSTRLVLARADAEDGATDIHDATTGDRILRLVGHGDGSTRTVAWSPDGSRIVTGGGGDHTAYVWDAMSGALVHCVSDLSGAVDVVAWSPDSTHFLTGSDTDSAAVWNADSKQLVMRLDEDRRSQALAWSPDGSRVVVCSGSHAQIWHSSGEADQTLAPEFNYLARQAVDWSPDGTHLLMSSEGNTARMWNTTSGEPAMRLAGHLRPVRSVAWSPDASKVITGGYDDTARIWDVATAETVLHLTGHEGAVNDVAWSPDGSMVITGSQDGTAYIWNTTTGEPVLQLSCDAQPVKAVAWVPDGTRVLTVTERNSIRLWTISTGEFVDRPFGSYFLPVLSPDNSRVITGAIEGHPTICDAATGEPIHELTGHVGSVSAAAWSPDGTRVITGSDDQTARIWNATTGEEIHNLVGHTDWVLNVSWSPDGTRVLTTGDDNTVRIWDAATGGPGGPTFLAPNRNEIAVYDRSTNEILGATKGAWRWLGWTVVEDGRMTRLPAETFGPIPLIEF
ncbi:pentapeptide repeat-containing protein [Lentzea alba]|uniref:WD40 domain-containing protein n=1 Tax=Lentzea alba TaxID=2714351 RepID=UPI0039BF8C1A